MSNHPPDLRILFPNINKARLPSDTASPPVDIQQQQQAQQQLPRAFSNPVAGLFNYAPPAMSSPLFSPPAHGTPPHHGLDVVSPNVPSPRSEGNQHHHHQQQQQQQSHNADRTSQLLNLLKFNQPPSNPTTPRQEETPSTQGPARQGEAVASGTPAGHTRGISASDLIASFMMPKPTAEPSGTATIPGRRERQGSGERSPFPASSGDAAQEMLLRLLNRPKAQQTAQSVNVQGDVTETSPPPPSAEVAAKLAASDAEATPSKDRLEHVSSPQTSGPSENRTPTFEAPKPQKPSQGSIFTYTNPFEQLAAASPRPKSGQGMNAEPAVSLHKIKRTESPEKKVQDAQPAAASQQPVSEAPVQSSKPAEVTTPGTVESGSKAKKETVPEALEGVAERVDMEAEAALARAAAGKAARPPKDEKEGEEAKANAPKTTASQTTKIAIHLKKEVDKKGNGGAKPTNVFENHEDKAKEAEKRVSNGDLADTWETESERIVPVYSFPIKPFVSITWKRTEDPEASIRDDGILNIAKLKKSFDQLDRSLTSATSEYIVYALAKNGGMRVIRQDDGQDRRVFHSSGDRIFHVALCRGVSSEAGKDQAVLGAGVSGAVYWAPITKGENDLFEKDALDSESLIFPPYPASDENTSGGQLKTRVRRSSRNPDFFAIGRGKSIYIVWPRLAMSSKYGVTGSQRQVETEKFFKERSLKIATGKAGKDFTFSDDDTVIVSLDKTGRMRFWDIRQITEASGSASPKGSEIRVPLLTLATGSPNEKSWPTSVLFVDRLRPYSKKCALRYVLVGLKQNHTLQLWDVGLGKAVQEVNFPHSNESDAICSVAYHPGSGIIVVGHPTRNSIYFIHLSTPLYALPAMSQGAYIQGLAEKDAKIPRPESTACMSGIRELSFNSGNLGQLRSLELLPLAKPSGTERAIDESSAGLFELYVMHSRGVTCLTITKADLGWSVDNKILRSVDSLEKGYIDIKGLQSFPAQPDEHSVSGDMMNASSVNGKEKDTTPAAESSRNHSPVKDTKRKVTESSTGSQDQTPSTVEKPEKKKKKKAAAEAPSRAKDAGEEARAAKEMSPEKPVISGKEAENGQSTAGPSAAIVSSAQDSSVIVSTDFLRKEVKRIENAVSLEFTKTFNRELDAMYRRFDEDRRAQDEAATARQDAVLRLISSTLSDNVEKNLSRIITNNVKSTIVPALVNVTTASMDKQINEILTQHLDSVVPRSINNVLSDVISRTLKASDMKKAISDLVAPAIVSRVEDEVAKLMRDRVIPAFREDCVRVTEKVAKDAEQRFAAKFRQYEAQQAKDNAKLDQLMSLVRTLSDTVTSLASTQSAVQNEILKLTHQLHAKETAAAVAPTASVEQRSPEEIELSEISQLMSEGKYEDASVRWLQSSRQSELFDRLFVNYDPSYLSNLSPIVALSVSAAVTSSLEKNIDQRLVWLNFALRTVDIRDPDIVQVAPQIMDIITQRLGKLYMGIAENDPHNPVLRKIPPITRWATDLKERAEA
ncbi:hypothetical protein VTO42DRAFT_366 [Malbranchea cinnamomea]